MTMVDMKPWIGAGMTRPSVIISGLMLTSLSCLPVNADQSCAIETDHWIEVQVKGFKDSQGEMAVELHPDIEGDYLDVLIDSVRVSNLETVSAVCLPIPKAGRYIVVVLHDRNANKKLDVIGDGFGFSRNPKIGLSVPEREKTAFNATPGKNQISVILNYLQGLVARPLDEEKFKQAKKRRRARRG